ncbi:MAG TPA: AMIN domain-containing protein, partial [Nitrospiria bacterium]|nr:AMIN domain-containing protein [Nitrospiria bacterium]
MNQWWTRAILSGSMLFALGCAAQSTEIKTEATGGSPIRLHVETPSEGVRLIIDSESPLVYTAFRLPDPPRLVLDLSGTSLSPDQQPIQVNQGAVTTIRPVEETAGSHTTRIEVGLTQLVDYQLRPDGSKLLVTFANPASPTEPEKMASADQAGGEKAALSDPSAASPAPANAAASENHSVQQPSADHAAPKAAGAAPQSAQDTESPAAGAPAADAVQSTTPEATASAAKKAPTAEAGTPPQPSPPAPSPSLPETDATTVSSVHVNRSGTELTIAIKGNGRFHPSAMSLSGPRLVIDLPGTTTKVRSRMAVNAPPLKRIRIGTHQAPQKVRIVFDLTKPVNYTMSQEAGTLTVTLLASSTVQSSSVGPSKSTSTPAAAEPAVSPQITKGTSTTAKPPPQAAQDQQTT